jgi:hypothetical protein
MYKNNELDPTERLAKVYPAVDIHFPLSYHLAPRELPLDKHLSA